MTSALRKCVVWDLDGAGDVTGGAFADPDHVLADGPRVLAVVPLVRERRCGDRGRHQPARRRRGDRLRPGPPAPVEVEHGASQALEAVGLGRRQLHGLVDLTGLHVKRPSENTWKGEGIVDLIGIVGSTGGKYTTVRGGEFRNRVAGNVGEADRGLRKVKSGTRIVLLSPEATENDMRVGGIESRILIARADGAQLEKIAALAVQGRIRPHIAAVLPLEDAARAHQMSATQHTRGKILLRVAAD